MANAQNNSTGRYAFLRALNIEQLEELLKTDYGNSMSEDASEEFIDAIIEVMMEKENENPSGKFKDTDGAWADFQNYYNVPERKGQLLYPDLASPKSKPSRKSKSHRPRRLVRRIALVAAIIGVFTGLLIVAQAAGLDVFGAMARWTNETFRFSAAPVSNEVSGLRVAMEEVGIPVSYAPTWIPDGFSAGDPQITQLKKMSSIFVPFSDGKKNFAFKIAKYTSNDTISDRIYEKKPGDALLYSNGNLLFYIFENTDSITATWTDRTSLALEIFGQISAKDMKSIINSIGGQV